MKQPNHNPLGADCSYLGFEVSKILPNVNPSVTYDLAISFLTPHNFVLDHVKAHKKICWIHTDYTRVGVVAELEKSVWEQYDYIASISSEATKTFLQVFPSCRGKVIEIENILSSTFVRQRAKEIGLTNFIQQLPAHINLLSIGRFCEAKNYDNVPDICKRTLEILKDKNIDIRWYIIGFGADENLSRQKIAEAGMQKHVIILGKKSNPYPYIKACDIYVQPSRYEGKSVTVREAQMLCKPVVVTNYPTANSQIKNGDDGAIVTLDNEGCAKGLAKFILDTEKQNHIIEYLKTHDYGNVEEIKKIYDIIKR
jgi:glycosyltransferase involved in cell wall biosynthesis